MIREHFRSPNTILANMRQDDFANNMPIYHKRLGVFFTDQFTDWVLTQWTEGFHLENIYSSMEFQHRVHVELRKEFK